MKKLLLHILFIMGAAALYAQPTYTVSPPVFTAEDEVTITVDVTATTLAGHTGDVWMWAWIAEGCSASCDAPTNVNPAGGASSEKAKMTRVSANVYAITFVPSAFYAKPPSEIRKIGFKLKSADWGDGKQSDTDVLINVEPLVFTPKVNRIFPTKVTQDDIVTLYLDQSVATAPGLKYAPGNFKATIMAYDEDDTEIGKIENAAMVKSGEGLHYIRIMPSFNFGRSDIHAIRYRFTNAGGDVTSDEFSLVFFQ
jgi:hypothetical protein